MTAEGRKAAMVLIEFQDIDAIHEGFSLLIVMLSALDKSGLRCIHRRTVLNIIDMNKSANQPEIEILIIDHLVKERMKFPVVGMC